MSAAALDPQSAQAKREPQKLCTRVADNREESYFHKPTQNFTLEMILKNVLNLVYMYLLLFYNLA